jgi:hypothetical protein
VRRGWSALLALLLVCVGAGLGSGAPRAATLATPANAGAGAADGRDAAVIRAQARPAVLTQRADDPHAGAASPEPVLTSPAAADAAPGEPCASDLDPHVLPLRAALPRPYQARAPPLRA